MKLNKLAAVAALAVAASSSFAADIDLGGLAGVSTTLDIATLNTDIGDVALVLGTFDWVANNAMILQEGTDGSAADAIAFIDQVGATASFAYIYQSADAAANGGAIAYIQQNATNQARAVITQR
jgi:hypothetical protein